MKLEVRSVGKGELDQCWTN